MKLFVIKANGLAKNFFHKKIFIIDVRQGYSECAPGQISAIPEFPVKSLYYVKPILHIQRISQLIGTAWVKNEVYYNLELDVILALNWNHRINMMREIRLHLKKSDIKVMAAIYDIIFAPKFYQFCHPLKIDFR